MRAPIPPNENDRLRTLRRHAIADTPPEAAYDRIASLAARVLQVPIALITFIDADRQWLKAAYGTDQREASRETSFCSHTILGDEVVVVPDASRDPRFADNPLVTGGPSVRFYAGAPLAGAGGANMGTLCIFDVVPRELSPAERGILADLAEMATDQLRLRLALIENNQLAIAVRHLGSGVTITDPSLPDGPIVFANAGFSATTGYAPEEVLGRNCRFLQGPDTDAAVLDRLREALAAGEQFEGLLRNYRKNGEPFWNYLTVTPVLDESGRVVNFVGLQNDVTVQQDALGELSRSFDRLRVLEAQRDGLTNMIIHDLRSPLTSTMGFLQLLRLDGEGRLDPEDMESIELAAAGADQLNRQITSLLDVSRLESGAIPVDTAERDLVPIIRSALESTVALEGSDRVRIELPSSPVHVVCDAELTRRVLGNLVGNALKFTPVGGVVRVGVESAEDGFRVLISDTGPGIPEEALDRVFEKFGQVAGSRSSHSTGLGLYFCRLATEAQGGQVGLDSRVGEGSTFWFTVPAVGAGRRGTTV